MPPRRAGFGLLLILTLATLLRLPGLSWLPSPNGDEGHWARYAERVYQGQALVLDPEHRGSSAAFAYLLGPGLHAFGDAFVRMRLVGVIAVLLACVACVVLLARVGAPRAGLAFALVLAVHPWSVMWSRTASVPYALALATISVGVVAMWAGLQHRSARYVAGAVLAIAVSAHFSPLAIVLVPACLGLALGHEQRWVWRAPLVWLATAAGALLTLPLIASMRSVPSYTNEDVFAGTLARLASTVATIVPALSGESTLRHFTNGALPLWPAVGLTACAWIAIVWACASREVRSATPLASFGLALLASGALLLPLVLAPARLWYLPTIDAERYTFVLLPGLALCLSALVEARRRTWHALVVSGMAIALLVGCLRTLLPLALGHGIARGAVVLEGGECYRGWLTTEQRQTPVAIVAAVARRVGANVLLFDSYAFAPMGSGIAGWPAVQARISDKRRWKREQGRFLFVLWANELMDAAARPRAAAQQRKRRQLIQGREFSSAKLEQRVRQPDGAPLLEIWSALREPRR